MSVNYSGAEWKNENSLHQSMTMAVPCVPFTVLFVCAKEHELQIEFI
jgi:hypothetical protein